MKIKLTASRFSHRKGKGYTRYVKGDVFEIDDRNGARLIKAGAAVEVPADGDDTPEHSADGEAMDGDDSDAQVADVQTDTDTEDTDEGEGDDEDAEAPTQESGAPLKGAGIAEWRKYAKKHSIDTANLSKQQIIAAVVAAES